VVLRVCLEFEKSSVSWANPSRRFHILLLEEGNRACRRSILFSYCVLKLGMIHEVQNTVLLNVKYQRHNPERTENLRCYEPANVKNLQISLNDVGPVLWALLNWPIFGMRWSSCAHALIYLFPAPVSELYVNWSSYFHILVSCYTLPSVLFVLTAWCMKFPSIYVVSCLQRLLSSVYIGCT